MSLDMLYIWTVLELAILFLALGFMIFNEM